MILTTFAGVVAALFVLHELEHNGVAAAILTALAALMAGGLVDIAVFLVRGLRAGRTPPRAKP